MTRRASRPGLFAALAVLTVSVGVLQAPESGAADPLSASTPGHLQAMSALSSGDVWAVGYAAPSGGGASVTRAEHWDGHRWAQVPTPVPSGSSQSDLDGVSAASSADVWAVGSYVDGSGTGDTLAEHWDGSDWLQMVTPNPAGSSYSILSAVTAVSPKDVWADGIYLASGGFVAPLMEHWNGHKWKIVDTPAPGGNGGTFLNGISGDSPTDVWAVGYYLSGAQNATLIEHWDGHTWTQVPSPNPTGNTGSFLRAIDVSSGSSAWAVGYYADQAGNSDTLVERWDGAAWTTVASPNPHGSPASYLSAVSADDASDAWGVGYDISPVNGDVVALSEHWDGTRWRLVKTPNRKGSTDSGLEAVAAISPTDAWTAGVYASSIGDAVPLVEHWNGTKWIVRQRS